VVSLELVVVQEKVLVRLQVPQSGSHLLLVQGIGLCVALVDYA